MSIAVAVRISDQIVMATDSKRTFGSGAVSEHNLRDVKLRKVGDAYLATTGWGVYANILDDHLRGARTPRLHDAPTIFAFFRNFWKVLHDRYAFVNDQCSETDSPFGDLDASFLVASPQGIFYVACDMSVTEFDHYYAVGSGAAYALGAMHALYGPAGDPEKIARRAIAAASELDIYCGGEVNLAKLKAKRARKPRTPRKPRKKSGR
jgi:ATP-dependent HslUV protease, peptidase subunit HslV